MPSLIEKIQQKPHHEKNRIILITIVVVVVVLAGIWAVIGIPTKQSSKGDIINDFNSTFKENKDTLPNFFPEN